MEQRKQKGVPTPETVRGVVLANNMSPRGCIERVLVKQGDRTIQINFPPKVIALAPVASGQSIAIQVKPEPDSEKHSRAAHAVYQAAPFNEDSESTPGEPVEVEGIVARLNFTRHGEPNGVVLDNGDFLHLKPDGMKRTGLLVGQRAVATGKARPMQGGHRVIEAQAVKSLAIDHKK